MPLFMGRTALILQKCFCMSALFSIFAANIGTSLTFDKNESLTYQQVIQARGKNKSQLYVMLNYWATATFKDKQAITLNDKDTGTIIISSFPCYKRNT